MRVGRAPIACAGHARRSASRSQLPAVQREDFRGTRVVSAFWEPDLRVATPEHVVRRHQDLLKGIYDMGFTKPSKIQERALPLLLSNP